LCGVEDCTILSARLGLSYEDGSEASPETGVYIHHVLSFSPTRPSMGAIGMCDVDDLQETKGIPAFVNKLTGGYLPFSPFTGRGKKHQFNVAIEFVMVLSQALRQF
jgi:hypothetical protein